MTQSSNLETKYEILSDTLFFSQTHDLIMYIYNLGFCALIRTHSDAHKVATSSTRMTVLTSFTHICTFSHARVDSCLPNKPSYWSKYEINWMFSEGAKWFFYFKMCTIYEIIMDAHLYTFFSIVLGSLYTLWKTLQKIYTQ